MKWWGYLHVQGSLHVKRYWNHDTIRDICDAFESDFVRRVFMPFEAESREEAIEYIKSIIIAEEVHRELLGGE